LEVHPEWKYESLDGILPFHFEQVNELKICLLAECILISDQSYVPLELNLQLAPDAHRINWLSCKLGMKSDGDNMQRSSKPILKLLHRFHSGSEKVDWAYHVQFGRKIQ